MARMNDNAHEQRPCSCTLGLLVAHAGRWRAAAGEKSIGDPSNALVVSATFQLRLGLLVGIEDARGSAGKAAPEVPED